MMTGSQTAACCPIPPNESERTMTTTETGTATSAIAAAAPTTAIRHRVGIEAPLATVHEALTTTAGIASWWTRDTAGDAGVGGTVDLHFGGPDRRIVVEV